MKRQMWCFTIPVLSARMQTSKYTDVLGHLHSLKDRNPGYEDYSFWMYDAGTACG